MKALQAEGLSQRRACSLVKCPRRTAQYRSLRAPEDPKLIEQVKELAERWPRFGYRRLMIMLRRKDITLSWWHLRRVYGQLSLQVRPRRKRHVRYIRGNTVAGVSRPNERWSVDFIHDRLALGRPIRAMVVVDDFTRECLAIEVGFSFGSRDVIRTFESISFDRDLATSMRFDRGSEFTSRAMLQSSADHQVALQFSDPGKPTQNAQVEALNGRIRDEFLNLHGFANLAHARAAAESWRVEYNETRPHSALGYRTPREAANDWLPLGQRDHNFEPPKRLEPTEVPWHANVIPESIAAVLRRVETGITLEEAARKAGVHVNTILLWKKKYGQLGTSEIREMNELRDENTRLKRLVADLSLDKVMLQDVLSKKL